MKKSPHSQAYPRTSANPNRERPVRGTVAKLHQAIAARPLQHDEPELPKGYRHIRDAIRALLTLDGD